MTHNSEYCPKYQDKVLPNEEGNCSLCNAKLTDEEMQMLAREHGENGMKQTEKSLHELLDQAIEIIRSHCFAPEYKAKATREECLGIAISHYLYPTYLQGDTQIL